MNTTDWNTRIIIAGSRKFSDYGLLKAKMNHLIEALPQAPLVISGTARGADQLGERWAAETGLTCHRMPADWDRHGKSAGYRRNEDMARHATHCVVCWDGNTIHSGSFHMINIAQSHRLPLRIVKFRSSASPADWVV